MNASPARRALRRPLLRVLGTVALLAGLALTSFGLYRLVNPASEAPPPSLASQHRTDPGAVYDRPLGTAPTSTASPVPVLAAPPVEPPLRDAAYHMIIDKIGVNAGVFTYGVDANRVPEVPLNATDVAWYNFSARPGTGSNAVFAGHVTWGGPAVFYDLDSLEPGDRIVLRGDDGTELGYVVSDTFLVDAEDPNSLSVMSGTSNDVITLITCGGSFYYTGDPVFNGDYTHRRIIRAAFTGVSEPAPAAGG